MASSKASRWPANLETVDQLMSLEEREWNVVLNKEAFNNEIASAVNQFDPIGGDKLVWLLEKTGKVAARSAYGKMTEHENSAGIAIFKKLWAVKAVQPRILHFIWRSLDDALTTNRRRARAIPNIDSACKSRRMSS